jgi:hypothetical protein
MEIEERDSAAAFLEGDGADGWGRGISGKERARARARSWAWPKARHGERSGPRGVEWACRSGSGAAGLRK